MRVLLISMPDTADVIDYVARLPNLAVVSLAGNLPGHEVKVLDLVLYKPHIRKVLEETLSEFRPQVVGLSAMTFQFGTLLRIASFVRGWDQDLKLVAGGYHATLMFEEITNSGEPLPLDFLVRGEGEATFAELLSESEKPAPDFSRVLGLSYLEGEKWRHNPPRPLLDLDTVALPSRSARLKSDFFMLHLPMDVAETSRGCPYNCKFCSITRMYGRTFRTHSEDRIVADLRAIKDGGTRAVFFADDNITHDIDHFRRVCRAIVRNGLDDLQYLVQVTAVGIAQSPELVAEMDQANFRYVFVGFEAMRPHALMGVNKPTNPEINRRAAALLREHGMAIIAGCIVGYPDDTAASVKENIRLIRSMKPDMIYAQYLTPYPKTVLRQEMIEAGLITNPDGFGKYDGFTCNIKTHHLETDELYRVLKREMLLSHFDPSLIKTNFFLRKCPRPFLRGVLRVIATNLYNIIASRQLVQSFDLMDPARR
jgi:anaerobic magnesium-protoporphyrin IX monomethyl ester cyclase